MSVTWKAVYEGEHEGRKVSIKESNDHTYKILTTQTVHDEGAAYQDGDRYVHVAPASVGEQVESEANSRDSLQEALKELHFSSETVSAILKQLP